MFKIFEFSILVQKVSFAQNLIFTGLLYARTFFMYGPVKSVRSIGEERTHAQDLRSHPP